MKKTILIMALVLTLFSAAVSATEHLIPLQGVAEDNAGNPLATGNISVRIYDYASGGLVYDSDFDNAITDGVYDILLGSNIMTPLDLDNTKKYYIEIDINGEEIVGDAFWPGSGDHTHSHLGLWNVSGSDIFSLARFVGIGTTSPNAKLDVEVTSGGAATIGSSGNSATGDFAVAMGYGTNASGYSSTAMGRDTTASGYYSTAMGRDTTASGYSSTAMGRDTTASGYSSTAMGVYTTASGDYSTAMGYGTTASGDYSTAMGREIEAAGDYSVGIGLDTTPRTITQPNTMAIMGGKVGIGTTNPSAKLDVRGKLIVNVSSGAAATIGSSGNSATGDYAIAMGYFTNASGHYSTAMGGYTTASNIGSTTMGYFTTASGPYSTTMGYFTTASGITSTAMGDRTTASGSRSTAMGYITTASGKDSTAMGSGTTANGDYSTAMGYGTTASRQSSTAMGRDTTASGDYSTAMGELTSASGVRSTAMGELTSASGQSSTAMGYGTTASGVRSTAMGSGTTASGQSSTAMSLGTTASGDYSTAMGYRAKASANYNFAWGGDFCSSSSTSCNNIQQGVFAVYGGLCVAGSTACPAVSNGNIVADGSITPNAFDLAERFNSNEKLEEGYIAIIDPNNNERIIKSTKPYDTTIAGIISTKPGVILGWENQGNTKLSLAGRVPTKVTDENGNIKRGDLLTTSSTPGHAMKCEIYEVEDDDNFEDLRFKTKMNEKCRNSILGKALEPCNKPICKIIVLVTLQ